MSRDKCWDDVRRTWEHSPTSERIVQDINRVFTAIDQVVEARGVAVDFKTLRCGRSLREHRDDHTIVLARARFFRTKNDLDMIEGLHPLAKQCIVDLTSDD